MYLAHKLFHVVHSGLSSQTANNVMVSPIFHKEATLIKTQTRMSAINDAILNLVVARSRAVWKIVIRLVALVSHLDCDRHSQLVTIPLC